MKTRISGIVKLYDADKNKLLTKSKYYNRTMRLFILRSWRKKFKVFCYLIIVPNIDESVY